MKGWIVFWKPSHDDGLHAAFMEKNGWSFSSDPVNKKLRDTVSNFWNYIPSYGFIEVGIELLFHSPLLGIWW